MMPPKQRFAIGRLRRSALASRASRLFHKGVPDRPHRPDEIGTTRGAKRMPEAANMNIDRPGAEVNVARPGRGLKLAAGVDAARILHEVDQQAKLGRREMKDLSVAPHEIGRQVDLEIVEGQHLRGHGMGSGLLNGFDHVGDELLRPEGPAEAFVGAGREEFSAVAFIARSEEHQDREGSRLPVEAELGAQRPHVNPGEPRLYNQDVWPQVAQPLAQPPSIRFRNDVHTDLLKDVDEKSVETVVLGSQQNRWRGPRCDRIVVQHPRLAKVVPGNFEGEY
jgi:hypothetical protein